MAIPLFITRASTVAPFTGAWIEMVCEGPTGINLLVAPFTGAWIEIGPDTV